MIKINEGLCVGCAACVSVCPDGFEVIEGMVKLKNSKAKGIKEAISCCPFDALV